MDKSNIIEFECPACATTYMLEKFSTTTCQRCLDDIGERHWLVPSRILSQRIAVLKAKKAAKK